MKIPEVGWLVLDNTTSPLRFYPIEAHGQYQKQKSTSVTLGNEYPATISIQSNKPSDKTAYHLPVRSKKTPKGNYQLGPFIAILTSDTRHPFAGNYKNFADLIQRGKRMGVTVYVLTLTL